tara:strand:+ start:599 stop:1081 length:483 start_codon:yes stop_codon:yes gene_type:complete
MSNVTHKYRFFRIPACGDADLELELNTFLKKNSVVDVRQEFVSEGGREHWCFSVRAREGASVPGGRKGVSRVDYKDELEPNDFALFAKLRDLRKEVAKKEEIPAYAVFTNEQLAAMARAKPDSAADLRQVEGVGESRAGKYGEAFLAVVAGISRKNKKTE